VSERCVRQRVHGLRELAKLAGDEGEPVLLLRRSVQALELVRDAVEALEKRVELAIGDVLLIHESIVRAREVISGQRNSPLLGIDGDAGELVPAAYDDGIGSQRREQPLARSGARL